jgi:hypothetical protein
MRRTVALAFLVLQPVAFASPADAQSERSLFGLGSFIGLWEGIDPVDGGDALRSIICSTDLSCTLAVTDSVITLCGGGPAFASGTGDLDGDELVFADVVLVCPDGTEVDLAVSYEFDPFNHTLVETAVVGDRPLPNIIFHKVSR